jgi:hypothetical protein
MSLGKAQCVKSFAIFPEGSKEETIILPFLAFRCPPWLMAPFIYHLQSQQHHNFPDSFTVFTFFVD